MGTIECPDCNGEGSFELLDEKTNQPYSDLCEKCDGAGKIEEEPAVPHAEWGTPVPARKRTTALQQNAASDAPRA